MVGGVDDAAGEGWGGWWVGWMMQQVRGEVGGVASIIMYTHTHTSISPGP